MNIVVNGEDRLIKGLTVNDLLDELCISRVNIAVELNKSIVPKGQFDSVNLADGDKIEIVQFVGGG